MTHNTHLRTGVMNHALARVVEQQLAPSNQLLLLNSAADPFVPLAAQQLSTGTITLAEDNIAALQSAQSALVRATVRVSTDGRPQGSPLHSIPLSPLQDTSTPMGEMPRLQHIPFHTYISHQPAATIDIAVMNLLYQPANAWVLYGLQLAAYALKPQGRLYVVGAKDRGIVSIGKRMQVQFGNVETLAISKGQRVLCSVNVARPNSTSDAISTVSDPLSSLVPTVFAHGKLDEGTQLLLAAVAVRPGDEALDIGCGAGFIGIHIARLATRGNVTMVDISLAAVDAAQHMVEKSGVANIKVLPSDGAQALLAQRFDLVVTNPPFHLGGIHTTAIAERFIREAAQVLRPQGRFYLVANRFLKYEPTLRACFSTLEEVGGNARYKVLRAI